MDRTRITLDTPDHIDDLFAAPRLRPTPLTRLRDQRCTVHCAVCQRLCTVALTAPRLCPMCMANRANARARVDHDEADAMRHLIDAETAFGAALERAPDEARQRFETLMQHRGDAFAASGVEPAHRQKVATWLRIARDRGDALSTILAAEEVRDAAVTAYEETRHRIGSARMELAVAEAQKERIP